MYLNDTRSVSWSIYFCNQSPFEFGHMMKVVILERCGTVSALNGLVFASFNFVVMENDDTDEEIFYYTKLLFMRKPFTRFWLRYFGQNLGQ